MYHAQFGPDMADVAQWQETAVHFIDNKSNETRACMFR
jgi:hypothetical protein